MPAAGARFRILIVDDNVDGADSLCAALAASGYEARAVYGGAAGILAGWVLQPDVVLLDLNMPSPDGYETCAAMKNEAWGRRALVVAISGWGPEADRRRTNAHGFDDHLVRPVEPAYLLRVLDRLLRRPHGPPAGRRRQPA
jgi:CheY-like chemotaxis protein